MKQLGNYVFLLSPFAFTHAHTCTVPPTIEPESPVVRGFRGQQSLEVECNPEGDPPPTVSWYFQGQKIGDSINYRLLANGNLLIVTMLSHLAGEYTCVAKSEIGNASAIVTVEYAGM